MFRQGKPRAFIHNLRLASMLSFVAGVVNISGVLSVHTLTTNVTGHFAFFCEHFVQGHYQTALEKAPCPPIAYYQLHSRFPVRGILLRFYGGADDTEETDNIAHHSHAAGDRNPD